MKVHTNVIDAISLQQNELEAARLRIKAQENNAKQAENPGRPSPEQQAKAQEKPEEPKPKAKTGKKTSKKNKE